jgi:GNAT superfamily N-acetyltransferase
MSIRSAVPEDLKDICALIVGLAEYEQLAHEVVWTEEQMAQELFGPNPPASVLMAIDDETGAAAGFALYFPTFSTFLGSAGIWLEDLFVKPQYRGKGFGLELLQTLRSMTTGRVEWNVLDWNTPSIEFYKSLGTRPVDGWTRYRWVLDPQN